MSRIDDLISKYCPNGVEYYYLGDVFDIKTGNGVTKKDATDDGLYPIISGGVQPMGFYSQYNREANTVTIARAGTAGYVNFITTRFWVNDKCFSIIPTEKYKSSINSKFLFFYLKNIEDQIIALKSTGSVPTVNIQKLSKVKVAVPPLPVQEEIVKILDSFTMLEAELEAELEARKEQYEHYRNKLLNFANISQGGVRTMALWEITNWDKKFNGIDKKMQEKIIKYPYLLADELFSMEQPVGNVFLLSTGENVGWTTEEIAGDKLCEGEVVTIPWGKSRPVVECMKYYKGKFVTADNRIATSKDTSVLNNKYLFYWMQNKGDEIDKFYRGAGIQHPSMKSVLTMQIVVPPLEEQERIVSILDKFDALVNDISKGLPAEINARKQQYEYYRNKLLDFQPIAE